VSIPHVSWSTTIVLLCGPWDGTRATDAAPRSPRVTGQAAVASQPRAPGPAALSHHRGGMATTQMAARWQVSPLPRALLLPPPPRPTLVEAACGAKASTPVWSGYAAWPRTSWGGEVMGCGGGQEAGDDVVMGAGPPAVQSREDVLRVGRALDLAGCSPRRKALDDRLERHAEVGGMGPRPLTRRAQARAPGSRRRVTGKPSRRNLGCPGSCHR